MSDPNSLESALAAISASLADGRYREAVSASEADLQSWPDAARLVMLYGIALGQSGRVDEAVVQLRRASMLAPTDPETFYNLAVQLFDEGDLKEAAVHAREALRLKADYTSAAELLAKCEGEPGQAAFEAIDKPVTPSRGALRTGPDSQPEPALHLGVAWTRIGYGLFALCVLGTALLLVHNPFVNTTGSLLKRDTLSIAIFALNVFTGLANIFWTLVDIIDRRLRFVWLLPASVFCFFMVPVVPLALYLFWGRKATAMRSA